MAAVSGEGTWHKHFAQGKREELSEKAAATGGERKGEVRVDSLSVSALQQSQAPQQCKGKWNWSYKAQHLAANWNPLKTDIHLNIKGSHINK